MWTHSQITQLEKETLLRQRSATSTLRKVPRWQQLVHTCMCLSGRNVWWKSRDSLKSTECVMNDPGPRPTSLIFLLKIKLGFFFFCAVAWLLSPRAALRNCDHKVSVPSAAAAHWRLMPGEHAYCPDTGIPHCLLLPRSGVITPKVE